ncbi:ABC transporter substrate-binding protein [bacterium]|nr:ABC transporter substrate-binding protein [bacterium]
MIVSSIRLLKRKLKLALIASMTILTVLGGEPVSAKTVITAGVLTGPKSVNPFVELTGVYYSIFRLVYDTLLVPTVGGKTVKNLATDIIPSSDGMVYTVKIRTNAVFLDGTPVTAEDVAFTHNYIIKNELGAFSQYSSPLKEVTVIDSTTVKMTLNEKFNRDWLDQNTFSWIPILPRHIWSKISKEEAVGDLALDKLIGSGPFTISEFEADHFTRLAVTDDGKKHFAPAFDEIIIKQYANDSSMLQDFKVGNLNIIDSVPFNSLPMMEKMENVALSTTPAINLSEVIFNSWPKAYEEGRKKHPHPALKDPKLRYALDWVLDENMATKIVHGKYSIAGSHMLPTGYNHYCNTSLSVRGYDIDKAKKILADAGYRDTDNDGILETADGLPLEFDVWLPAPSAHETDYAGVWARAANKVGIKLNISIMDFDTLWAKVSPNGNYDIAFWDWAGNVDPDFILSVLTSANAVQDGWSDSGYSNPSYDVLYDQQRLANSTEERRQLIWKMQEILYTDAPYLVYSYYGVTGALNTAKTTGDMQLSQSIDGLLSKEFLLNLKPRN